LHFICHNLAASYFRTGASDYIFFFWSNFARCCNILQDLEHKILESERQIIYIYIYIYIYVFFYFYFVLGWWCGGGGNDSVRFSIILQKLEALLYILESERQILESYFCCNKLALFCRIWRRYILESERQILESNLFFLYNFALFCRIGRRYILESERQILELFLFLE